ncbi:MAG: hypothetical protein RL302_2649, partial [Pseudomonadota bacterium]
MNTPLSARIAGYFGTLFLAAMVSMFALWYFGLPAIGLTGAGHMQLAEVTRAMEHEADHRRTMITQAISERRGDALVLAENRVVSKQLVDHDPHLARDFERVTSRLQRAYPDRYQDVLIVDPVSATVISSTRHEAIGHPFQDTALIARARAPGIRELVEQVDSPQGTTVAIVRQMFAPTDDGYPNRRLVGILITLISPRMLFPDSTQADETSGAAAGTTFLFDSHGEPLAQSVGGVALNPPEQVHAQVVNGFEGTLQGHDAMGKPTIQVVRHVRLSGNVGWALVHQIGQEEALATLKGSINTLVVVGLLMTVLALVVFTLAAYRLTLPLRALARTARQVGKGDLSARAPLPAQETREIITLAQAFNDMADNVEQGHLSLESAVQTRTLELAGERDRAQGYLDIVGVMLLALDVHCRIAMVNAAGAKLLGHPEDALLGLDWFDNFVPIGTRADRRQKYQALVRGELRPYGQYESEIVDAWGAVHTLSWHNAVLKDGNGKPTGTLSSAEDITQRKAAEAELRVAAIAFESQQGMYVADANWAILRVNRAFTVMMGYSAEEALGQKPAELFGSERTDQVSYAGLEPGLRRDGTWQGEVWNRRKDGSIFPVWLTISAVTGDGGLLTHYVVSLTDITERKATEDEIRNLAFYDPLTGLPNRRLLMDRLGHAMAGATRHRKLGALLFVDLDHFKTLNDTLGHDKGDLLLEQVATRLRSCTR